MPDKPTLTPEQDKAVTTYKDAVKGAFQRHALATAPHSDKYLTAKAELIRQRGEAIAALTRIDAEIQALAAERQQATRPHDARLGKELQDAREALSKAGVSSSLGVEV